MQQATLRRRAALFALFLLPGLGIASWMTRTPDIRDLLGASTAEMGFILFGLSVGSMAGILCSARLVARWGTRPVIALGTALGVAGVPLAGIGIAASSPVLAAAGLALFGLGIGCGEVAMNIEGAEVERGLGRSVLPTMHGFFSLGTVVGGLAGLGLTAVRFPVVAHLVANGVLAAVVLVTAIGFIPAGVGRQARTATAQAPSPPVWRDSRMLLLGVIVLALALSEGAANDWLPLIMVDGHGAGPALGSAVFVGFAAAMALGRFAGGAAVDRFGRATALRVSILIGVAGIALVIFADSRLVAAGAALLWGLGAALGFPVAVSAAGEGDNAAARVSFAATVGYTAFLVGPPTLGLLGDHFGLRRAMIVVLVLVAVAAFATPAARPRTDPRGAELRDASGQIPMLPGPGNRDS
ncbi:MFS transporter [Actinoplanes sp. NPDC051513]|uniref:MFS transporter n=1 Tax=Actinoplanes sp. NPDC051513 TaxID=3363908 RepID=UPI0037B6203B